MTDTDQLLALAIKTAKAGKREEARQLLMQVLEQDEENEMAWLWLSGTVKSKEDRQVCLENVLAINRDKEIAKKGLKKLGIAIPQPPPPPIEEEPEVWDEPYYDVVVPKATDPYEDKFKDAWSSSANLCAYCATPVVRSDKRCPKCRRRMVGKEPVFPGRSKYLLIWVALRSINHSFSLLWFLLAGAALFELLPELPPLERYYLMSIVIGQILSIGFTVALFFRQRWAYWLAILGLLLMVMAVVSLAFLSIPLTPTDGSGFFGILCIGPFIMLELLYIYMVIMSGGDFKHVKRWRIAAADDRIKDPLVLHKAGKMFAKQGRWATAVLYWQRAASRSPGNIAILLRLADGYAHLGFPARSRDTLQAAREKTKDPKMQALLSQKIDQLAQAS